MNDPFPPMGPALDPTQTGGSAGPTLVWYRADQRQRWQRQERVPVEAYLEQQPALRADAEAVLDLIYNEVVLRTELGETPALEEYQRRFPELAGPLKDQFDVHRALEAATLSAPSPPPEAPPPGPKGPPVVPGYEILGKVGSGAFGVVYQARHLRLNRVVALKMVRDGAHAGAEELARFRAEAEAVARLSHPNIVQIHEIGDHEGLPFLALEFVKGGSLAERLDGTPQAAQPAARLVETLARAVHAAHERGVVHRDLKPGNVLLSFSLEPPAAALAGGSRLNESTPKITDFGLAKRFHGEPAASVTGGSPVADAAGSPSAPLTQTGAILGTPSYMAPEQASGSPVGPAADIYALGAILYELLTGRPPFKAQTPLDTLLQVIAEEPVPVRRLQPKVPRDLETICFKCLRKEAGKRYGSARELAEDLHRFLAGEPIRARPVPMWERGLKWARRRPALAALVAVSVSAALALVILGVQYNNRLRVALQETQERELAARRNLYVAHMNLAGTAWRDAQVTRLGQLLDEYRSPVAEATDLRGFEWYYLDAVYRRGHGVLPGRAAVAYSPDGRRLATAGPGHTVVLWEVKTRQAVRMFRGHAGEVTAVAFSPDGRWIASASRDRSVRIWDLAGDRPPLILKGHTDVVTSVAFRADGRQLASGSLDRSVRIWDPATGREMRKLREHGGSVYHVAYEMRGTALASAGADHGVILWESDTGQAIHKISRHTNPVAAVAFSPDGKRLASASWDQTVRVWAVDDGRELLRLAGHRGSVTAVAFSPDGRRLASAGWDRTVRIWDAVRGTAIGVYRGHRDSVVGLAYRKGGRQLASVGLDHAVRVWDVTGAQEFRALPGHSALAASVDYSGNGRQLVSAGNDGTVRVWDARTGAGLVCGRGHKGWVNAAVFSPDGRRLASAGIDRTVRIWDAGAGRTIFTLTDHRGPVTGVAWSGDGRWLASGSEDQTIKIWDPATGKELRTMASGQGGVRGVALDRTGRHLASAGADHTVRVWDLPSGRERLRLTGHTGRVNRVVFSADDERLASAADDQTVIVWDADTGQKLVTLRGHTAAVHDVAFGHDGRRLATASGDGTVKIWDAATGQETLTLDVGQSQVWGVALRPDGRQLAIAGGRVNRGEVRLWDAAE
jgi:WD40 repeat protein/serine/threonine protein kinase